MGGWGRVVGRSSFQFPLPVMIRKKRKKAIAWIEWRSPIHQ
ncbi:hypothetical protein [Laspinema olomoucense]|nr:hypothetical protein [Laspinema sp. D3d]